MESYSWQQAKFIAGPRKGDLCWVYLVNEQTEKDGQVHVRARPFFATNKQIKIPLAATRVVAVNAHCATHWPGHLHGTRLDWIEMRPRGANHVELEDICLGEEIERAMFGKEYRENTR